MIGASKIKYMQTVRIKLPQEHHHKSYSHVICLTRDLIGPYRYTDPKKEILPPNKNGEMSCTSIQIRKFCRSLILARITSHWVVILLLHKIIVICLLFTRYNLFPLFFCSFLYSYFGQRQKATQLLSMFKTTLVKVGNLIFVEL